MTNNKKKYPRHRYEVSCTEEELEMINELGRLEGKKRNKVIIELVKRRLEELREGGK